MKTTIDGAGRIVVPKPLRDSLGLRQGDRLEVRERDGVLEVTPIPVPVDVVDGEHGPVAVARDELPPLTDDIVRATLERIRR